MAKGIVEHFQTVHVKHDQTKRKDILAIDAAREFFSEKAPVIHAGQIIVGIDVLDFLLSLHRFGDVAADADGTDDFSVFVTDRGDR